MEEAEERRSGGGPGGGSGGRDERQQANVAVGGDGSSHALCAGNLADALKAMVNAAMLSTSDAGRLTTLLQSSQEDADASDDVGAPAAATYESHSSGIVETLTDLLEKAEGQLDDTRKKETQDKHAFEMLKQSLEDEIKYANKELGEAKAVAG